MVCPATDTEGRTRRPNCDEVPSLVKLLAKVLSASTPELEKSW